MKARTKREVTAEMLDAYLEGEVTVSEAQTVEAELEDSAATRRLLETQRRIRLALTGPTSNLQRFRLADRVRCAINEGRPPRLWQSRFGTWFRPAAMAAAVLVVILGASKWVTQTGDSLSGVLPRTMVESPSNRDQSEKEEFRPKGTDSSQIGRGQWAGIHVYRTGTNSKEPAALGESISRSDALLFSYSNLGPKPFEYVMIFAIDAGGEVFWFYPAYEKEGTNPTSIPVRKGVHAVILGESIRHDFVPGPLEIRALFTDRPVQVLDVESWLAHHSEADTALPWADSSEQTIRTGVALDTEPSLSSADD